MVYDTAKSGTYKEGHLGIEILWTKILEAPGLVVLAWMEMVRVDVDSCEMNFKFKIMKVLLGDHDRLSDWDSMADADVNRQWEWVGSEVQESLNISTLDCNYANTGEHEMKWVTTGETYQSMAEVLIGNSERRMGETKEDAAANELVFTPWWKDNTTPDAYLGGTPKAAEVNVDTLRSHSDFLKTRRSKSLPRGGALEPLTRMAMKGLREDDKQTDRQARRHRSPSQRRQTGGSETQAVDDMRMFRENFTTDWTAQMEEQFESQICSACGAEQTKLGHTQQRAEKLGSDDLSHRDGSPHLKLGGAGKPFWKSFERLDEHLEGPPHHNR